MTMYRVRAQIRVPQGDWEPYDATINSTREIDDLPPPGDIVRDIQHQIALSRGGNSTDVLVRDAVVSAPE